MMILIFKRQFSQSKWMIVELKLQDYLFDINISIWYIHYLVDLYVNT